MDQLLGRRGFIAAPTRQALLDDLRVLGAGDDEDARQLLWESQEQDRIRAARAAALAQADGARRARKARASAKRRRERRRLKKDVLSFWSGRQNAKVAGLTKLSLSEVLGWDPNAPLACEGLTRLGVGLEGLTGPRERLEGYVRLDVRLWFREGRMIPGKRRAEPLCWDAPEGPRRLVLISDLRSATTPALFLAFNVENGPVLQRIGVVLETICGRLRPGLICPVTGKRVEVLVFRNGRFASAVAQKLAHSSQFRPK